jgi:hypothetical protein
LDQALVAHQAEAEPVPMLAQHLAVSGVHPAQGDVGAARRITRQVRGRQAKIRLPCCRDG